MKLWKYIFIVLLLILSLVVIADFQIPDGNFHIIACNVGQGDATLLIYKNIQVLVDGGPDQKVLDCLGKYLPFYDRDLELVISTHPDADHFMGLIEVFRRYKVDNYLVNNITISKPEYQVLEKEVGRQGVSVIYPHQGREIKVDLIQLDTLAPLGQSTNYNLQFTNTKTITDTETNEYSIVSLARFKNFSALLTGDIPTDVSDNLAVNWRFGLVNYIKISHHGSKNGLTQNLLEKTMPGLATISVGKNNYGHPSQEILQMLNKQMINVLRTDKVGDIEVITDGMSWWLR